LGWKKGMDYTIDNVKYVEFEHWPSPPKNANRKFRLKPQKFSSTINFPITQDLNIKVGNVCVTQIPVNANIATTGHKLQGMSKDILIVNNWNLELQMYQLGIRCSI
jgi:hypothetical protein